MTSAKACLLCQEYMKPTLHCQVLNHQLKPRIQKSKSQTNFLKPFQTPYLKSKHSLTLGRYTVESFEVLMFEVFPRLVNNIGTAEIYGLHNLDGYSSNGAAMAAKRCLRNVFLPLI